MATASSSATTTTAMWRHEAFLLPGNAATQDGRERIHALVLYGCQRFGELLGLLDTVALVAVEGDVPAPVARSCGTTAANVFMAASASATVTLSSGAAAA